LGGPFFIVLPAQCELVHHLGLDGPVVANEPRQVTRERGPLMVLQLGILNR
jgi:hypothetical protein